MTPRDFSTSCLFTREAGALSRVGGGRTARPSSLKLWISLRQKGDPNLGGSYVDTGGLRHVRCLTGGADQREDQPPHSLRRPRDDLMVEHRGRRPCRAAQSPK